MAGRSTRQWMTKVRQNAAILVKEVVSYVVRGLMEQL